MAPKIPKPQKQGKPTEQTEIQNDGTWEVDGEIFLEEQIPENELRSRHEELADVTRQIEAALVAKRETNSRYTDEIKGLRGRASNLAKKTQPVSTPVRIAFDPTKKAKFIFHRGTEDLIRKEPMTAKELASGPVGAQQADAIEAAQEPPFRTAAEREQDEAFEN